MHAAQQIDADVAEDYSGPFAFFQGQRVAVVGSKREGTIVARTEHMDERHEYSVRFVTESGIVTRVWFNEIDIEPVAENDNV